MIFSFNTEILLTIINITIASLKFFNGKFNKKTFFAYASMVMPIYCTLSYFNNFILLAVFIIYSYPFLIIKNVNYKNIFFIITSIQGITLFLTSLFLLIFQCFSNSNTLIRFIIMFISNCSITVILLTTSKSFFINKIKPLINFIPTSLKIYTIISLHIVSVITIIIEIMADYLTIFKMYYNLVEALILGIIIIFIIPFSLLISNTASKQCYKKLNDINKKYLEIQLSHYQELSSSFIELREFKHNYKNQLIILQAYLDNNNITAAQQYLGNSFNLITEFDHFETGNYILDAILNEKLKVATQNNIQIIVEGTSSFNKIPPEIICIIFGNALDNALEACCRLENYTKVIRITLKQQNNIFHINITNPYSGNLYNTTSNIISTTKSDSKTLGFGLISIKKAVEKYGGNIKISGDGKLFTLSIIFLNNNF